MKKVIIGACLLLWAVCTNAQSEDIHYQVKGEKNTYGIIYSKKQKYSFIQNMGAPLYKPVYYDDHYVRIVRGFRITDISHDEEYIKKYLVDVFLKYKEPVKFNSLNFDYYYDLQGRLLQVDLSFTCESIKSPQFRQELIYAFEKFEKAMKKHSRATYAKDTSSEKEIKFSRYRKYYKLPK